MKKIGFIMAIIATTCISCEEKFIDELYEEPTALFTVSESINKGKYEVFESIQFQNTGDGQYFTVYPGDKGHVYNQNSNRGYPTASNGSFSYSYQEVGTYTAVWVASSIKKDGTVVRAVDSVKVEVVATNGGLKSLSLNGYYTMPDYGTAYNAIGTFISKDTIMCPLMYASWAGFRTFSTPRRGIITSYSLASKLSALYWKDQVTGTEKKVETASNQGIVYTSNNQLQTQDFVVRTASGFETPYYVAPVMIPQFTAYSIQVGEQNISGTIERDPFSYNKYTVTLPQSSIPAGTDLSKAVATFKVVNNDANLTDGTNYKVTLNGIPQISGETQFDFSSKSVTYTISMRMLGDNNPKLKQDTEMVISIK